jgi:hypothetical protein
MVTRPALPTVVLCAISSCAIFAGSSFAAAPAGKKATAAKSKAAATRTAAGKTRTTTAARKVPVRNTAAARTSQAARPVAPSSDRIKLVQAALAERGYLNGDPTGVWDSASVEALKKMEADHNVKVDGKLDSKMLILLGLGPRYESNLSLPGDEPTFAGDNN